MARVGLFTKYIIKELLYPLNYISAFIVGFVINYSMYKNPFNHFIPYLIPIVVQSFSKASVHFKNRNINTLLLLPKERVDPTFLTDSSGGVITCAGNTKELFKKHNIKKIDHFLEINEFEKTEEAYSPVTKKWYRVDKKLIKNTYLIWLTDISLEIQLRNRMNSLSDFNNSVLNEIEDLIYKNHVFDKLAKVILDEGYKGLFITSLTREKKVLKGYAYKYSGDEIVKSNKIKLSVYSHAPVTKSFFDEGIIIDSVSNYISKEDFIESNPINPDIQEFIGSPIENYINYSREDISFIAFNKDREITELDKKITINVVDRIRIIKSLMHLAKSNDLRFLESIEGLCAAAEYSDEITGKHIYRVNRYSELIARHIGLDEKRCIWIGQVAAIHDIGKVAMPELIKIDRVYNYDERYKMQMHTVIGANIIKKMINRTSNPDKRLVLAREIALLHHQEWCGKGYPGIINDDGTYFDDFIDKQDFYSSLRPLKGYEIPVEALIVSLADRYDALRSPRHYKEGFSHSKTIELLNLDDRSGRTGEDVFGPTVYKCFQDIHDQMKEIYESMEG